MKINPMIYYAILAMAFLGMLISVTYLIGVIVLKSQLINSIIYYVVILLAFMFTLNLMQIIYRALIKMNIKKTGFVSMMMGHLTNEQISKMDVKSAIFYEYMVMRLDLLMPAFIVFGFTIYLTIPPLLIQTQYAELLLAAIVSVFVLTYMVYTVAIGILFAIKNASKVNATDTDRLNENIKGILSAIM